MDFAAHTRVHPPFGAFPTMERLCGEDSLEKRAHLRAMEDGIEEEHGGIDERILGYTAAYSGFERYLSGQNLFILPRTRSQLESTIRRYSTDAVHNAISKSRSTFSPGGYSRCMNLAADSIRAVLDTADNAAYLLALHSPQDTTAEPNHRMPGTNHEAPS
ncbi:hypothetical protein HMN09_01231000 [Mycena chlorophos]|uniref:Uncharacterized protein n=1 Tax=Mycena chlorophos TaxID=658473 RepID=A0A8H6VSP9_MYCCL|nr:hypothetical protein HMN09_01231000 [Mycena chlorophos]